jgi:outer membrane protein, adhesin transport system
VSHASNTGVGEGLIWFDHREFVIRTNRHPLSPGMNTPPRLRGLAALLGTTLALSMSMSAAMAQPASATAPAPPAEPMAYLDAMRAALESTPNIQAEVARARSLANEVQRARGKHLPTLSVNSGLQGSGGKSRGATASVNVYAFGAIEAQIKQQRSSFDASRYQVMQVCADTLVQTSDAYLAVLRADALQALWREHLAEYASVEDMVQQIAAVDRGRRVDVEQVLTRKGLVQLSLLDAQNAAQLSRLNLQRYVGRSIEPVAPSVAAVSDGLLPGSAAEAAANAEAASPGLAGARHDIQAAKHAIDVTRGARFPQLNLVANSSRDAREAPFNKRESVGLQLEWNLFNGGTDYHAERISQQAVVASQARMEESVRALQLEVGQTWQSISIGQARTRLQNDQARPARAVYDSNRELFRLGRRSVLDLLNSANDVHAVKTAALESRIDVQARSLRLHVLTGRLMSHLAVSSTSVCSLQALAIEPSMLDVLLPPVGEEKP